MHRKQKYVTKANKSYHSFQNDRIRVQNGDVLNMYHKWESPTVIVVDGPYGLDSYEGDLSTVDGLADFYESHVLAWSRYAMPNTTLWFWNSELGWATVHPLLLKHGWQFVNCHVWNKGLAHIAGNSNTKTLRKFPVVTEVCVQYVRKPQVKGRKMCDWLRSEWQRSGLPLNKANEACGVKDAATRKYLTQDHLWYFPPPDMFEKIAKYANKYGDPKGRPYFRTANNKTYTKLQWQNMRAKFTCSVGITNVWDESPVNGQERIHSNGKTVHPNQKPIKLLELAIKASSDHNDVVWEPFGGLCSVAIACMRMKRICRSAETNRIFYQRSVKRLADEFAKTGFT